jgi:hypothetical protein
MEKIGLSLHEYQYHVDKNRLFLVIVHTKCYRANDMPVSVNNPLATQAGAGVHSAKV